MATEQRAAASAALQAETRRSSSQAELSKAALADLEQELEDVQRQHAKLEDAHSTTCSENTALKVCSSLAWQTVRMRASRGRSQLFTMNERFTQHL